MESRESDKISYALKRELKGQLYRELLEYSLNHCSEAVVVVRSHLSFGENGKRLVEKLSAFSIPARPNSPWAGAQLFDSQARFVRFTFCKESMQILLDASKKLYEWEQPALPEDLSLFRPNGNDWLITMAHSRQAYLLLSREERAALLAALPKLSAVFQ